MKLQLDHPAFLPFYLYFMNSCLDAPGFSYVVDQLPAKLIKAGSTALAGPISTVFNLCAKNNQFPNDLKSAQVCPIYKKRWSFCKKELSAG